MHSTGIKVRLPASGLVLWVVLLSVTVMPFAAQAQRTVYTAQDGRQIYNERCAICHLQDGRGSVHSDGFEGFPPLIGLSEWMSLREGQRYVAHAIIYGPYGGVVVGNQFYFGMMPRFRPRFTNEQIVAVIRYVAEELNTPLPGYKPIDPALVEEARRLPDTIEAVHEGRNRLPPR
ncbi:MAG: c-type cytochrome [Panacagrimonas sp.]